MVTKLPRTDQTLPREISESINQRLVEILVNRVNEPVGYSELAELLEEQFKHRLTARAIHDRLARIRKTNGVMSHLKLGRPEKSRGKEGDVTYRGRAETLVERRAKANPDLKRYLGEVIWHFLLGLGEGGMDKGVYSLKTRNKTNKTRLDRRIEGLRSKSVMYLNIDAGSTNEAVIEALIGAVPEIPFPVENHRVTPFILTNSLTICDILKRSEYKHSLDEHVALIGGYIRMNFGSIVGESTHRCLDAWDLTGDLSIIGTTGIRRDHSGCLSFGSDSMNEASLKARLLSEGGRLLSIVVMDSSKAANPHVSSVFASLAGKVPDLLVVDDGKATESEEKVDELVNAALAENVSVLMATPPPEKVKKWRKTPQPKQAARSA